VLSFVRVWRRYFLSFTCFSCLDLRLPLRDHSLHGASLGWHASDALAALVAAGDPVITGAASSKVVGVSEASQWPQLAAILRVLAILLDDDENDCDDGDDGGDSEGGGASSEVPSPGSLARSAVRSRVGASAAALVASLPRGCVEGLARQGHLSPRHAQAVMHAHAPK